MRALQLDLGRQFNTLGDIVLQPDEMADALLVAHRRQHHLIPERFAVLAIVAHHRVAAAPLSQGSAQLLQLQLGAILAEQEATVTPQHLLGAVAGYLAECGIAVDQRHVLLARIGDGHTQRAGLHRQVGASQLLLNLRTARQRLTQIAQRTPHQQGSAHQQHDGEVQLATLQIQLAKAQAAAQQR